MRRVGSGIEHRLWRWWVTAAAVLGALYSAYLLIDGRMGSAILWAAIALANAVTALFPDRLGPQRLEGREPQLVSWPRAILFVGGIMVFLVIAVLLTELD